VKIWHAVCLIALFNLLTYCNSLSNGLVGFDDNAIMARFMSWRGPIPENLMPSPTPDMPLPVFRDMVVSSELASTAEGILFGRIPRIISHSLD